MVDRDAGLRSKREFNHCIFEQIKVQTSLDTLAHQWFFTPLRFNRERSRLLPSVLCSGRRSHRRHEEVLSASSQLLVSNVHTVGHLLGVCIPRFEFLLLAIDDPISKVVVKEFV